MTLRRENVGKALAWQYTPSGDTERPVAMVLNETIFGSFLERKDMSVRDVRQFSRVTLLGAAYHVNAALCAWTIELVVPAFSRASRFGTRNFEGTNQAAVRSSAMSMELEGTLTSRDGARSVEAPRDTQASAIFSRSVLLRRKVVSVAHLLRRRNVRSSSTRA